MYFTSLQVTPIPIIHIYSLITLQPNLLDFSSDPPSWPPSPPTTTTATTTSIHWCSAPRRYFFYWNSPNAIVINTVILPAFIIFRLNNRTEEKFVNPEVHHLTSFSWVSQTLTKVSLDANQQRAVHMTACFSKPGIYNVNRLSVFVTYTKDASEMVLQKHPSPSVVTVQDVSTE